LAAEWRCRRPGTASGRFSGLRRSRGLGCISTALLGIGIRLSVGCTDTARVGFVPKIVNQVEVSPIESRTAGRIDVYRSFRRTIRSPLDDRVNSLFGWAVAVTAVQKQLQALASLRRQRFAFSLRRLGGLRRSGGRLTASPMLSASTGADLADIDFLKGSCTSTAHLRAPPKRRFASSLRGLDASWRPGRRLEDSPTLSPSAGIDFADIVLFVWRGEGCTDTAQLRASLPSRRFASTSRRLGGLRRPGGRLARALILSESAVVDLAVGGFLAHIAFCGQVGGGGGSVSVQPSY